MICWGQGSFGKLGQGSVDNIGDDELLTGIPWINTGHNVSSSTGGINHTCALTDEGSIMCFGQGSFDLVMEIF